MRDDKKHVSKGNDEADVDKDPAPAELEIDQANDAMGGPTTESLNAGKAPD
jgi:hypothetical protein